MNLLTEHATHYEFFQLMRVLRRRLGGDANFAENVRFCANLGLSFTGRDIESIEMDADYRARVSVNFFGLYGTASPLPTFYTEDLLGEARRGHAAMRGVFDVLHNVLYPLLYRAWCKSRVWLTVAEHGDRHALDMLLALVGSALGRPHALRDQELLCYAGLFVNRTRSAAALAMLVRGVTAGAPVEVTTCVRNRVSLPAAHVCHLGRDASPRLGDAVLGTSIERRCGVIGVCIGPVGAHTFDALLPGATLWIKLRHAFAHFLREPARIQLTLLLRTDAVVPVRLGVPGFGRLGQSTWLAAHSKPSDQPDRWPPGAMTVTQAYRVSLPSWRSDEHLESC
ncbi:type VI secretion protein [Pandoraea iniqua]|uniref:Type VI secretion protein n=1 Tax=Pandoraea iniqua TaxID=2508288 RepID=A0A5E4YD44_9BURK|nr:type VI secretion system baseplate subunit TssG [Pandoraea iniqua]VVE46666.1 type VI secretion protein [Pandoraea iniqua]